MLLRILAHRTLGGVVFVLVLILRGLAVVVRLVCPRPLPIGWLAAWWRGRLQLLRWLRCITLILVRRTSDRRRGRVLLLIVRLHLRIRWPAAVIILRRGVSRWPTAVRLWCGIRVWPGT